MADAGEVALAGARLPVQRWALDRPWVRVLAVYAAARIHTTVLLGAMLAVGSALGLPFPGVRGQPTFFRFLDSWDGWFYRIIATQGYPTTLPRDSLGHVLPNAWAFLPVFPTLERGLTALTGLPVVVTGAVIATAAGAGASVVLERLLRDRIGEHRALWAVGLFAFGPLAFVLQVTYAESVFLLLLFAALLAIDRERYLVLLPLLVLAAFTRPGAVAVPAALALQLAVRWWRTRRPPPRIGRAAIAIVAGGGATLAWPVIVDHATGTPGAYLATELSWWTGWVGRPDFVPFTPWFLITSHWLGPAGVVLAVLLAIGAGFWLIRRSPKELGGTIRVSSAMYLLYLAAVFLPQVSLPRLLMPVAPLLGAGTFTGTAARRRGWGIAAIATQPVGIALLWFLGYP